MAKAWHIQCFPPGLVKAGERPARWQSRCDKCGLHIPIGSMVCWAKTVEVRDVDNPGGYEMGGKADAKIAEGVRRGDPAPAPKPSPSPPGEAKTPAQQFEELLGLPPRVKALEEQVAELQSEEDAEQFAQRVVDELSKADSKLVEQTAKRVAELKPAPTIVELKKPDVEIPVPLGVQHKQFPLLLKILASQTPQVPINVWLPGPAGSGKTSAAHECAKALDLEFFYIGAITDPYQLLGFNDANGKYVATPFFRAWTGGEAGKGSIFLFDDTDGSDPAALVALNALLANGTAAFPHGMFARHEGCRLVATANTWGHGANSDYVGRAKQDGATLDRFVFLPWDYDPELEKSFAPTQPQWVARVQKLRAKVREAQVKVLITPRATVYGARLLDAGIDQATVEMLTLRKGMTDDQWKLVNK